MPYPVHRPRRLRKNETIRRLLSETRLGVDDLIAPVFVKEGITDALPIASMPGIYQHTLQSLRKEVNELVNVGVSSVILFGVPSNKDSIGSSADDENGIVQLAVKELKNDFGDELLIITDDCLDEFTDHGHCGILNSDGSVNNDKTLDRYASIAVAQANAGADVIAPSGMMDGQVGAIRKALDENGFSGIPIMAYSAKYASAEYGPFRDAAECAPSFGDRRSYQMQAGNQREALLEVELDVAEGADIVMVKPALAYLDVIKAIHDIFPQPIAAYHVSGEYAMLKAAAANGWIDGQAVALEHLTSIKRAGADLILTYLAKEVAPLLAS
ncbi:MAG: porphobilinogen synthase [Acidimicrobiia bacterium]